MCSHKFYAKIRKNIDKTSIFPFFFSNFAFELIFVKVNLRRFLMKTIYSRYDKTRISDLPVEEFKGRIFVVLTEAEAEKAVDYLLTAKILGVDSETRPSFQRGERNKVALLQVSTHDTCFLFRLNQTGLCPAVIRLLENTTVPMIGLSWHDDLRMLHGRGDFTPGLFIELQHMVGEIGIKDIGLQKVYANLFEMKLSKRQRLTNWEAPILTDAQKAYAALDAQACVRIYEEIIRLKETHDYELIVVPEPEPPQPKPKAEGEEAEKPKKKKKKKPVKKKPRTRKTNAPAAEKSDNSAVDNSKPEESKSKEKTKAKRKPKAKTTAKTASVKRGSAKRPKKTQTEITE